MSNQEAPQSLSPPVRSKGGLYILAVLSALLLAVAGSLFLYNRSVSAPVASALAGETGAETRMSRRNWISSSEIVFDIRSVDGSISMADMTRRLLKAAEALKDKKFQRVFLAYKGEERFYLDGSYFNQLGEERSFQNPVYTIRTLPEHVFKPDGTPAFETWTGGWLGVMSKQLEDSNEFHRQWWVNEAVGEAIE